MRWTPVEPASVLLVVWNSRCDADNVAKTTLDALQGPAFPDDRAVQRLTVERCFDGGAVRIEVTVTDAAAADAA